MTEQRSRINLDELVATVVEAFPAMDPVEQRVSIELYRLLAKAKAVPRAALAERSQIPLETIDRILEKWPGVFSDRHGRAVGYWGLSIPTAYQSPHLLIVGDRQLSAWCAWDTLFLPEILGEKVHVQSTSPDGGTLHLTVTPEQMERVAPSDAWMSFLRPETTDIQQDVVTSFCHFIHFFTSRDAGEDWVNQHAGTFLLSIDDAYEIARRKNQLQYRDALR